MFYFLIIKRSYLLKDADEITDGLVSANLLAENIKILFDVEISESMVAKFRRQNGFLKKDFFKIK
jgi:hypothetical protein